MTTRSLLCDASLALAAFLLLAPMATSSAAAAGEARTANTIWWVIFNHPEFCATSPCGLDDLFNPPVEASVFWAAGEVPQSGGDVRALASLYETGPGFADLDSNTSLIGGPGLLDSREAEIHLVVRSHGPLLPGLVVDQLTVFLDPGCQDAGGPNECVDIQAAIHQPTDEDVTSSDVLWLDDLSVVPNAQSRLIRLDGGVKVLLRTNVVRAEAKR